VGYRERMAIEGVSGVFAAGSLTAIVGANGAGKTTLLHAIAGLVACRRGSVEVSGADLPRIGILGRVPPELRLQSMAALQTVGLDDLARRMLAELSVGQFRRALFARVIVQDAKIVLLDEPFAGVDAATSKDLLNVMHRWHDEGRTVMVALHDLDQVFATFPETLLLARRTIAWGETTRTLTPESLRAAGLDAQPGFGSRLRPAMPSWR
jgi:zinc/manganese transport system ATP-binding protein